MALASSLKSTYPQPVLLEPPTSDDWEGMEGYGGYLLTGRETKFRKTGPAQ